VHVSNNTIASLFQQMQAMASGSSISASFGAQLTGQNLPTIGAGLSAMSSQAPSPLSSTPSSQFASNILSELLAAQQSPQSGQADPLQAMGGRHHHHHRMKTEATTDDTSPTASTATSATTPSGPAAEDDETPEPASVPTASAAD
jgi:hypothetical protein